MHEAFHIEQTAYLRGYNEVRMRYNARDSDYHYDSAGLVDLFLAAVFSLTSELRSVILYTTEFSDIPEPILESPRYRLEVSHPSSTSSLSSLSLLAPLVRAQLGAGVAALGTSYKTTNINTTKTRPRVKQSRTFVLTVKSSVTASAADGVGLGVAFTGHVK